MPAMNQLPVQAQMPPAMDATYPYFEDSPIQHVFSLGMKKLLDIIYSAEVTPEKFQEATKTSIDKVSDDMLIRIYLTNENERRKKFQRP